MKSINLRIALMIATFVLVASVALASTPSGQNASMEKVRKELVTLPYYGVFDNLEYQVEGSTVTLYGQVAKPITRHADLLVCRIVGAVKIRLEFAHDAAEFFEIEVRISSFCGLKGPFNVFDALS